MIISTTLEQNIKTRKAKKAIKNKFQQPHEANNVKKEIQIK
jgi:hypothetical protein